MRAGAWPLSNLCVKTWWTCCPRRQQQEHCPAQFCGHENFVNPLNANSDRPSASLTTLVGWWWALFRGIFVDKWETHRCVEVGCSNTRDRRSRRSRGLKCPRLLNWQPWFGIWVQLCCLPQLALRLLVGKFVVNLNQNRRKRTV